jgi:hypothetical protein
VRSLQDNYHFLCAITKSDVCVSDLPEDVARNRAHWDDLAPTFAEAGERAWARVAPTWGIWHVPEAEVRVFSENLAGKDAIELGCGTVSVRHPRVGATMAKRRALEATQEALREKSSEGSRAVARAR